MTALIHNTNTHTHTGALSKGPCCTNSFVSQTHTHTTPFLPFVEHTPSLTYKHVSLSLLSSLHTTQPVGPQQFGNVANLATIPTVSFRGPSGPRIEHASSPRLCAQSYRSDASAQTSSLASLLFILVLLLTQQPRSAASSLPRRAGRILWYLSHPYLWRWCRMPSQPALSYRRISSRSSCIWILLSRPPSMGSRSCDGSLG